MEQKKVVFNSSTIYSSFGGISRYSFELFKSISKKNNEFLISRYPASNSFKNKKKILYLNFLRNLPLAYLLKKYYEDKKFKNFTSFENKFDIYHETNFLFKPFKNKKVLTVHDLSWISNPEFHPRKRVLFMEKYFEKSLNQASAIVTVSNHVKKDVIKNFNIPEEKIFVTHLGCASSFKKKLEESYVQNFLKLKNLKKNNFLLVISTIEPRKNIVNTIRAYNNLSIDKSELPLVIVGSLGWKYDKILDLINNSKGVVYFKNINDEDLNILLFSQKICIFNSFSEGFGLPIIESMNFSKPVITSNNSSMREIAESYAILNDPNDVEGLTKKMSQLINDHELYNLYSDKSFKRSMDFSWDDCAKKTLEVYRVVSENS